MADQVEKLKATLSARYQIQHELGAGGMATVYLAEDVKHRRQVAIKVLRPELAAPLGPERFLREIEIAAKPTHPHIIPLYDSGEAQRARELRHRRGLYEERGETENAVQRYSDFVDLWANADPQLQPVVTDVRRIARLVAEGNDL